MANTALFTNNIQVYPLSTPWPVGAEQSKTGHPGRPWAACTGAVGYLYVAARICAHKRSHKRIRHSAIHKRILVVGNR